MSTQILGMCFPMITRISESPNSSEDVSVNIIDKSECETHKDQIVKFCATRKTVMIMNIFKNKFLN